MKKHKILVFCPVSEGGLAEHVFYQARTLTDLRYEVEVLVPPRYLPGKSCSFKTKESLLSMPGTSVFWLLKRVLQLCSLCYNYYLLAVSVFKNKPTIVLIDSFREYLAPFWFLPLKLVLKYTGATCVVNLHDPVRNYVVGPMWWHNFSVKCGYSFIHIGLVHATPGETACIPTHVTVKEVPVGVYDLAAPRKERIDVRNEWKVQPGKSVFLSFGFIRDNKNIDLLIRALQQVDEAFLVVAGKVQSAYDRPVRFYRELAESLGVNHRCYFFDGFVGEEEISDYFNGADFIALTYAGSFYSQSGVLNIAAASGLPVLASGAEGPLTSSVRAFALGEVVEPDSVHAIAEGMKKLIAEKPEINWDKYKNHAGWLKNITLMLQAVEETFSRSSLHESSQEVHCESA